MIEPNPAPRKGETAIEFGILVVAEALVVAADLPEPVQPESGMVPVIDIARDPPAAMQGAAGAEPRVRHPCGRPLEATDALRIHWRDERRCAPGGEILDATESG